MTRSARRSRAEWRPELAARFTFSRTCPALITSPFPLPWVSMFRRFYGPEIALGVGLNPCRRASSGVRVRR